MDYEKAVDTVKSYLSGKYKLFKKIFRYQVYKVLSHLARQWAFLGKIKAVNKNGNQCIKPGKVRLTISAMTL